MTTLKDLASELTGHVPIDFLLAKKFVQRAYKDVCKVRDWSFLRGKTQLIAVDSISTGTITFTQFSQVGIASASAKTVFDSLGIVVPITQRQVRVGGGPFYSVTAYDPTGDSVTFPWNTLNQAGALLFDRPYQETSGASSYTLSRCYYNAPSDFLRWMSVYDPVSAYDLDLHWTQQEINLYDPLRSSSGQPYVVAAYQNDPSGFPLFELWPCPTVSRSYLAEYRKRGVDLADSDSFPLALGDDLLMSRARFRACEWAEGMKGADQKLKGSNWLALMGAARTEYDSLLGDYVKADRETYQDRRVVAQRNRRWNRNYIGDSNWQQQHEWPF
jgi:hypothetical protein